MSNMMTQPRNFALCGCWGRLPSQDTVESTRLLMDYSKVVLIKIYVIKVMLQFTDPYMSSHPFVVFVADVLYFLLSLADTESRPQGNKAGWLPFTIVSKMPLRLQSIKNTRPEKKRCTSRIE